MRLRRDLLLFGLLAVVAAVGAGWLVMRRPGAEVDAWRQAASARAGEHAVTRASAGTFRATICAPRACVLVEAGGLAFLFGAGAGAAEGLQRLELMRADLDAVVLSDLSLEAVEGLPGIAAAASAAGRNAPLGVFGPGGVVAVVDGANLLASAEPVVRLGVRQEGEDQGVDGRIVFDSGVVTIRAFGGGSLANDRAFRVSFEDKAMIIGGCRTAPGAVIAAARGTESVSGVLAAGSGVLAPEEDGCTDLADLAKAVAQGRLSATMIVPAVAQEAAGAWRELAGSQGGLNIRVGKPGDQLDLTASSPRFVD